MAKKAKRMGELKCYKVRFYGRDDSFWWHINTTSPGKAKYAFYQDMELDESFGEVVGGIEVRCVGRPHTSEQFKRTAEYRGIEFAYCGMRVEVGGKMGVIVGHNDSANLNVLFADGCVLNCHPHSEIRYFDRSGAVIRSYLRD